MNRYAFTPRGRGRARDRLLAGLLTVGVLGCQATLEDPQGSPDQRSAAVAPLTPIVYLKAVAFQVPAGAFGNAAAIQMWGYSQCQVGFTACTAPTVPGPQISIQEGAPFTIYLMNGLTGPFVEPTSVVIPGQVATMTPVWIDPASGAVTATGLRPAGDVTSRVRSFTSETPADGATVVTYSWPKPKAGTYLYQSGTHPSVQVQMGLFGALHVYPAAAGQAYGDASSAFNSETDLVFSEIDPALHQAVECNNYGPTAGPLPAPDANCPAVLPPVVTSTEDYHPAYFLINGQPYSATAPLLPGGAAGQKLLLRFLNAGLQTKVPVVQGPYLSLIAEDGNFYSVTRPTSLTPVPAPRVQYDVLLPAGKTVDAIVTPTGGADIPIYDRRLNLTNAGASPGGMMTYLAMAAAGPAAKPLTVAPTALPFGSVTQGATQQLGVTVSNTGVAARAIVGAQVVAGGANPLAAAFTVTFTSPVAIPTGGNAAFAVTFAPTTAGPQTATLNLLTNDPNVPVLTVALSGTGA